MNRKNINMQQQYKKSNKYSNILKFISENTGYRANWPNKALLKVTMHADMFKLSKKMGMVLCLIGSYWWCCVWWCIVDGVWWYSVGGNTLMLLCSWSGVNNIINSIMQLAAEKREVVKNNIKQENKNS